jgi:poly(3-hydroxybutyrate) depolymerase
MMLYHLHDWKRAVLTPWRLAAEATQAAFQNPLAPASYTQVGRAIAAGAELFERTTRTFNKPAFGLKTVKLRGQTLDIHEEISARKPFCNLLHFKRSTKHAELSEHIKNDPKVLIVAPMSGHHATLLRGTVEAMLPENDVYVTDWTDARLVPLSAGKFDLEDNITYIMEFIRLLGPDVHLIAVCQPAPPVLCAVALLADMNDPAQPRSMTLMGGPIDTRKAKTVVTELAAKKPLEWFRNTVIHAIPFYYPGAYRLVYPGFIQLHGFMSMNIERHIGEHFKLLQNLVRGDGEPAETHRKFYNEYLSVMDVTAEFYLQTIERVFQTHDLPLGTFRWKDRLVKPAAIRRTALLTIEGELDDISAPGQTLPAHDLCSSLSPDMKQAHLEIGVGHYGIFNGRRWRSNIQPLIQKFIQAHRGEPETGDTPVKAKSRSKVPA